VLVLRRITVRQVQGQAVPMNVLPATAAPTGRIRFGRCVLDDGRGTLTAADGTESILRPKTLDLLRLMLRNPGRVVSRNEILDAIWPGLFVTDDSITQCVVEIRRAMGEGGAELLKTIPRRGYLLEAEVTMEHPAASAPPSLLALPADRPSIAVLPFRKDRSDAQEDYFADGVIEGIVHVLSGLERISVISRGSALALAETTVDPREVGQRLGVRYVLYGGVRRAGDKLRITTELSETETGAIIRTDRYEGDVSDLFALQDRIAEQVVATIAPQVRERELARALRKPPSSLTAYDLVLRALDKMRRLDHQGMEEALGLLKQAMEADPSSALPYSYTAWWHSLSIAQGWSENVLQESAVAGTFATAALERDHQDAYALALRGFLLGYMDHDFEGARRLLDRAVAASPSCAMAWSWGAALRCWDGKGEEAIAWAERGLRLAPFDSFTFLHEHLLAQAHYTAGDYESAIGWARNSAASNPHHGANWRLLVAALVAAGRVQEAADAARHVLAGEPGFSLRGFAARTPLKGHLRDLFVARLREAGLPE
jgi:TolB-like protein